MRNINRIIYMAVAAIGCGLLPFGCVKEDAVSLGERHDVTVQLNVGTRAVNETEGTPTDDESRIHTLRVYAFAGGRLAGHYFTDNVAAQPHTFFMDLTFFTNEQEVNFYVVANEGAMVTGGQASQATLSENTTEQQLKDFWFTSLQSDIQANGLPMFCVHEETLYFENEADTPPTDPEHAGHTLLKDKISFTLQRPVGKLGVFAAKDAGETGVLRVTGLTLLASGTRTLNYLMPQSDETLKAVTGITGNISLAAVKEDVTAELDENASTADRQNAGKYTHVLNEPFYPFENPWGSSSWNTKGDENGNVLQIDYTFDGEARTGHVYMPPIERNKYYTVCCLMHNSGKITVVYTVADWDDETYELEFDYPSYDNPITPADGSGPGEGGMYPQPTVWYNNDPVSDQGSYSFTFKMSAPDGQKWTPTLLDATPADFEVTVYQNGAMVDPGNYVASSSPYQIKVKALKPGNVDKDVSLSIAYSPSWDPEGTSPLLINGQSGSLKWEGSTVPEAIVIKQTDVPIK